MAPAGTPKPIIDKINAACERRDQSGRISVKLWTGTGCGSAAMMPDELTIPCGPAICEGAKSSEFAISTA